MDEARQIVFDALESLKINYELTEHPAVFTIEEMERLGITGKGEVVKNLFLSDEKDRDFYILVLCREKRADLKDIRAKIGSRRLQLASEDSLYELLKLRRGAVTPFGILCDVERKVQVIFDKDVFGFERIGIHPNDNTATVWLAPCDLKKIIEQNGNVIKIINI